jgi:hypothetical protein
MYAEEEGYRSIDNLGEWIVLDNEFLASFLHEFHQSIIIRA